MPKVEFVLQMFVVCIFAAVALFTLPFVLAGRKLEETAAAGVGTGMPRLMPEAEAIWGGVALAAWSLYVVVAQGPNLVALATGIGLAIGVLPPDSFRI
jgi:hypothetical protein